MVSLIVGVLIGGSLPVGLGWLLHRIKGRSTVRPPPYDQMTDPQIKHWALEACGRVMLRQAVEMQDWDTADMIRGKLHDLTLLRFAQGWGETPQAAPRLDEEQQRQLAQWN